MNSNKYLLLQLLEQHLREEKKTVALRVEQSKKAYMKLSNEYSEFMQNANDHDWYLQRSSMHQLRDDMHDVYLDDLDELRETDECLAHLATLLKE